MCGVPFHLHTGIEIFSLSLFSIPVIKKWIGPAKDSVTVQLKKVGSNDVIMAHT